MDCEIHLGLVGCSVVIEIPAGQVEGYIKSIDSTLSKITVTNGTLNSEKLPYLYRVYAKDINKISVKGEVSEKRANGVSPKVEIPIPSPPKQASSPGKPRVNRVQKNLPAHIKTLDNNIAVDILTNKIPQKATVEQPYSTNLLPYDVIENIDGKYREMINALEKESIIGLSMEGVRIGRSGIVCWIGLATTSHVYLLDMCSLGPAGVRNGLKEILQNSTKIKVTHDCRFLSDAFLHQYNVRVENVFDTQVGAAFVEKMKEGRFNRFVPSLTRCLTDYLGMPAEAMFQPRVRAGHEKEDESKWKQRPLPSHLLKGAVFNVCHLRKLRMKLVELLLSEVVMGTDIYLKEVAELADDECPEKEVVAHLIPVSFEKFSRASNQRKSGFISSTSEDSCDPYLSFTRHIPHVRKP